MDNVRRSLESELDRSRSELHQFQERNKSLEIDNQATFKAEKLLAALSNTLDQVFAITIISSSSTAVALMDSAQTV